MVCIHVIKMFLSFDMLVIDLCMGGVFFMCVYDNFQTILLKNHKKREKKGDHESVTARVIRPHGIELV